MEKMNVALLSTGNISRTMAKTLQGMDCVNIYAVASRTLEKAVDFANEYGVQKAYGSYEEMACDDNIDLVYVATPMSEHYKDVKMFLEHGKNVLCEKAFAINEKEAEEMIALAREKKLLLAEAMWVRYMPMVKTLQSVIRSGIIGEPMTLTANLGYLIGHSRRLQEPELGGGALLDVGVYTLNFASIAFGDEIEKVDTTVLWTESGVDAQSSTTYCYKDGKMAILNSSLRVLSDRQGIIYGTKGFLVVENINNFESITVYNENREIVKVYEQPKQITGYEYEVEACKKAIEAGAVECPEMPHSQTLEIMRQMDTIRAKWGLKYPME